MMTFIKLTIRELAAIHGRRFGGQSTERNKTRIMKQYQRPPHNDGYADALAACFIKTRR